MNVPMDPIVAPADARVHAPWPLWKRITAYAVLATLAVLSIRFIDRRVDVLVRESEGALPAAVR